MHKLLDFSLNKNTLPLKELFLGPKYSRETLLYFVFCFRWTKILGNLKNKKHSIKNFVLFI